MTLLSECWGWVGAGAAGVTLRLQPNTPGEYCVFCTGNEWRNGGRGVCIECVHDKSVFGISSHLKFAYSSAGTHRVGLVLLSQPLPTAALAMGCHRGAGTLLRCCCQLLLRVRLPSQAGLSSRSSLFICFAILASSCSWGCKVFLLHQTGVVNSNSNLHQQGALVFCVRAYLHV